MDTASLIAKVDVEKLLHHYDFQSQHEDGKIIRSACAIHGGDNPTSFAIDRDTTLWYCHTGCGGGDVFTLVQRMEECTFIEAVKWIANFFDIDISGVDLSKREDEVRKELSAWMAFNKAERNKLPPQECTTHPDVQEMAKWRTFTAETMKHFGVAFLDEIQLINKRGKSYKIFNRIFFPIVFNDIYVGFSLRRTKEDDIMKWSHQPRDFNVGRILYNYDAVCDEDEIIVCEGAIDVMACYEAGLSAVATFGSNVSDAQAKLLLQTGADITFCYDADKAGQEATQKAARLLKNKATLRQIVLPQGEDPESVSRAELREAHDKRIRI